jgi:hypothetical protein
MGDALSPGVLTARSTANNTTIAKARVLRVGGKSRFIEGAGRGIQREHAAEVDAARIVFLGENTAQRPR